MTHSSGPADEVPLPERVLPLAVTPDDRVADGLATALLAGDWTASAMARRVATALGRTTRTTWIQPLADAVAAAYRDPPADRPRELAAYLRSLPQWRRAWTRRPLPRIVQLSPAPTTVVRRPWPVAELPDLAALCRLLDLDQGELGWFADTQGRERRASERLRHYRWLSVPKRGGVRLLAAPKPRLKEIQRRLLRHVLTPIPVHPAAHGAVVTRSVRTAIEPHAGQAVVIRVDLSGFFAAVPAGRVYGLLRAAGLPEPVAHTVTGLLTTVVPIAVSRDPALATPHLPQGAPTSPRAANLVAFSLDRRLAGLAQRYGAAYTRYVDDLVFSGGTSLRGARSAFVDRVRAIVRDEGFGVNERKTVVLGDAGRQQLLGAVANAHPATPRAERDALRATLHNCATQGWPSQAAGRSRDEFRSHLLGRVAWVGSLHPPHGRRLAAIAERINWDAEASREPGDPRDLVADPGS